MHVLSTFDLALLHIIHVLWRFFAYSYRRFHATEPQQLEAGRRHVPKRLALLLVTSNDERSKLVDDDLFNTVVDVVKWCRKVGIYSLSVYNRQGTLFDCAERLKSHIHEVDDFDKIDTLEDEETLSDSDIEYPLTPPMSDYSNSRSLSPCGEAEHANVVITMRSGCWEDRNRSAKDVLRRRRQKSEQMLPFELNLYSYNASKPLMASITRSFTKIYSKQKEISSPQASVDMEMIDEALQDCNLNPPDFMVVHQLHTTASQDVALELHGFPPWLLRLTEIHGTSSKSSTRIAPLTEIEFRRALDEFASAEMRLGK